MIKVKCISTGRDIGVQRLWIESHDISIKLAGIFFFLCDLLSEHLKLDLIPGYWLTFDMSSNQTGSFDLLEHTQHFKVCAALQLV